MISSYVLISSGGSKNEFLIDRPKFNKFKNIDGEYASDTEQMMFGVPTNSTMAYSSGNMRVNNNEFYYPTPPGSAAPSSRQSVRSPRLITEALHNEDDEDVNEEEDFFPFPAPSIGVDSAPSIQSSPKALSPSKASTLTSESTPRAKKTTKKDKTEEMRSPTLPI